MFVDMNHEKRKRSYNEMINELEDKLDHLALAQNILL